jgi:hypothetical protein
MTATHYEVPHIDTVALVDLMLRQNRHTALCLAEMARHVAQAWQSQHGHRAAFGAWLHADMAGVWAARSGLSCADLGRIFLRVKTEEARRAA